MKNSNNITETKKSLPKAIVEGDLGVKNSRFILSFVFLLVTFAATAQPLPPSGPSGNPVPVGGGAAFFLAILAAAGIWKLTRKKR